MLTKYKTDIISNLNDTNLIPSEIWKIVEKYTETEIVILWKADHINKNTFIVYLIDIYTGEIVDTCYLENVYTFLFELENIKLTSDGKHLVYMDTSFNIIFYNIRTKKIDHSYDFNFIQSIYTNEDELFFDNDGQRLIFSRRGPNFMEIYDIQTQTIIQTINMAGERFFIDKNYKILIGSELYYPTLYIWNIETGNVITTIDNILSVGYISPDGKYIIVGGMNDNIFLYKFDSNITVVLFEYTGNSTLAIAAFAFSKDGKYAAACYYDETLIVIDIINEKIIKELIKIDNEIKISPLLFIDFSNDNKYLTVINYDKSITTYDWNNNKIIVESNLH